MSARFLRHSGARTLARSSCKESSKDPLSVSIAGNGRKEFAAAVAVNFARNFLCLQK